MPGGIPETDPEKIAKTCELFMSGTKRLFEGARIKAMKGDMWLFELYHHLNDCTVALRRSNTSPRERSGTGESSEELSLAERGGARKNPPNSKRSADK